MSEPPQAVDQIAAQIGRALEAADLTAFADLLDPGVHWGPAGDQTSGCQNRKEVMRWYRHGREAGTRADVVELLVVGQRILVGLKVRGRGEPGDVGGAMERWQVLTVRSGLVVDIAVFEDRGSAADWVGVAAG